MSIEQHVFPTTRGLPIPYIAFNVYWNLRFEDRPTRTTQYYLGFILAPGRYYGVGWHGMRNKDSSQLLLPV